MFREPRSIAARLALAAVAILTLHAQPADAGVYKLYSCNVPGRATPVPSVAPWTAELDGVNTFRFDGCVSGGPFGIGLNVRTMRAFATASLVLERPNEGPKAAIGIVRYRTWITAELSGTGAPAFVDAGGSCGPPGCVKSDDQPWVSAPLSMNNARVVILLRCTAGDCAFDSEHPLQVRGAEVDLYEDVPPAGEIEGGTLLNGSPSAVRTVSISATDAESGVARVEALLGDTVVATQDLEGNQSLCPHTDFNACPPRYATDLSVDTSRVAPGTYGLTLRVFDAAGNRRVVASPRPVVIGQAGGGPVAARLTASFAHSRATYTTNFGRRARLRGGLTDPLGRPIARATLSVVETPLTTARKPRMATITTGADGRFAYSVSGRGPSRNIELRYGAAAVSRRLRLRVRAASSFKVSLHGIVVRYAGRVLTRPLPSAGKRVYIQGRSPGTAWHRFAVRRTDRNGRFSGRYKLRVHRPGVKLQFRLEIPKESGYAYEARTGGTVMRVVS